MQTHYDITMPAYSDDSLIVDEEFDGYDLSDYMEIDVQEAEIDTFYADAFDLQE